MPFVDGMKEGMIAYENKIKMLLFRYYSNGKIAENKYTGVYH